MGVTRDILLNGIKLGHQVVKLFHTNMLLIEGLLDLSIAFHQSSVTLFEGGQLLPENTGMILCISFGKSQLSHSYSLQSCKCPLFGPGSESDSVVANAANLGY